MPNVTLFKKRQIWWMQYRIHGTRIRKSLGTTNELLARRKAKVHEQKLLLGDGEGFRGRILLPSFWDQYLPFAQTVKRPKTLDNDTRIWHRFQNWLGVRNLRYLDQISASLFDEYRRYLLAQGLQKTSVNVIHRHLSSILSYGVRQGYLASPPLQKLPKYKVDPKAPKFLNKPEIERLLKIAQEHSREAHLIFGLGIYAGLRRNEIAHARWEWFDLENEVLLIQSYGTFVPKSHRMRPVPLHQKLKEILWLHQEKEGYLFNSPVPEEERKNLLRYDFKNSFRAVTKKASLEWVTPHVLRHTFASQLALAGVSLYKIQQWLGHSDPKTTMIYAHLQAQDEEINLI